MNKRKERSEGLELPCHEQLVGDNCTYGFGEKRRNLNDYYNGRQLLGFVGDICEKENSTLPLLEGEEMAGTVARTETGNRVGNGNGNGTEPILVPGVTSGTTERGGLGVLDSTKEQQNYAQLVQKYENLQISHATLQKVVKSLLDRLSQLNELCSQKDRELSEYKVQLKKLVDANETLNMYIQSSHSSLMSNSIINKFGSDIY